MRPILNGEQIMKAQSRVLEPIDVKRPACGAEGGGGLHVSVIIQFTGPAASFHNL